MEANGINVESIEQRSQEQSGEKITLTLGTYASVPSLPLNMLTFEEMLEWFMVQQYYSDTGDSVPFYFGE